MRPSVQQVRRPDASSLEANSLQKKRKALAPALLKGIIVSEAPPLPCLARQYPSRPTFPHFARSSASTPLLALHHFRRPAAQRRLSGLAVLALARSRWVGSTRQAPQITLSHLTGDFSSRGSSQDLCATSWQSRDPPSPPAPTIVLPPALPVRERQHLRPVFSSSPCRLLSKNRGK